MRTAICLLGLLVVLGVMNNEIRQKENLVGEGQVVLLELAPRDPRSLMQGDYMVLRYALARRLPAMANKPHDGQLVLALDEDNVATFRRIHDGSSLAADEILLNFRYRRNAVRLGAESFFFEEGSAGLYRDARYGELRVNERGESVLVGLRDESRQVLGMPPFSDGKKGLVIN